MGLDEAAAALNCSREEVYSLVRRGELHGVRTADGRWMVAANNVEAFRAGRPQSPGP